MTSRNADAAAFWNQTAEKYAASPVADVPAFERKKAITQALLPPNAKVLEIGCGTGSLALEMAPFAGHIHALDISSEMVRIADAKKSQRHITNVHFHVGPLDGPLPAGPGELDAVWAYSILHLADDRQRMLERLFELLRPGGSLASSNVCLKESLVPYGAIIAVMRWFGQAPRVHVYDRGTILRELREVGFENVQEHDVGASNMVAFITATKPSAGC